MSNKTYDTLKLAALIAAPLITLVCAILKIWDVPHTTELTATFAAIDAFLGALVQIFKTQYDRR